MATVKEWIRKLNRIAVPEVPRAERLSPPWLAACYLKDGAPAQVRVKDISSTGLYLLTGERWAPGELISFELRGEGLGEIDPELHLDVEAKVVRHGEDGVGLSFVLPEGLEPELWASLLRYLFVAAEAKDVLVAFRMLRAVLFVGRLCRSASQEAIAVLGDELNAARAARALEIALRAEELLGFDANARGKLAHPRLVARILREGSWSTDDLALELWSGLLAASCGAKGADDSNDAYVGLLSCLSPEQVRIMVAGCTRAIERMQGDTKASLPPILVTPTEMTQITGVHDLARNAMDMVQLFDSGLLEKQATISSYLPVESFCITPSALGLELFRHCRP